MQIFLRFIVLITLALLGGLLYALSTNIFIMAGLLPTENLDGNVGFDMTQRATFVWIGATFLGLISIFIKEKWRYGLLILPLIAPSLFALLYSLSL